MSRNWLVSDCCDRIITSLKDLNINKHINHHIDIFIITKDLSPRNIKRNHGKIVLYVRTFSFLIYRTILRAKRCKIEANSWREQKLKIINFPNGREKVPRLLSRWYSRELAHFLLFPYLPAWKGLNIAEKCVRYRNKNSKSETQQKRGVRARGIGVGGIAKKMNSRVKERMMH